MAAVERIRKAEGQVAAMQSYLGDAQQLLGAAEEVALAGRKAKRCTRRIALLPITILGIAVAVIIWRRLQERNSEGVATADNS